MKPGSAAVLPVHTIGAVLLAVGKKRRKELAAWPVVKHK
jgi:hypothetical protein